jgi:hypothetical protein
LQLEWKRGQPVPVTSAAELDAALDAIEQDRERSEPVLAFLTGPAGFMTIGLGHPKLSILMYRPHDGQTPMHAVGNETERAANEAAPFLTFSSYGRPAQFAKWCGLPRETARAAARSFLSEGGVLWNGIRWEEEKQPA